MKIFAALVLLTIAFGAAACNTMQGAGEDVSAGGRAIQRAAD